MHCDTLAIQLCHCSICAIHGDEYWVSAINLDILQLRISLLTFFDLNRYGTYFVFASFITLSIPFVYFCVPETKGLSLEEIETLFGGQESALESDAVLEEAKSATSMHIERSDESR
jgi:hypothetical protein